MAMVNFKRLEADIELGNFHKVIGIRVQRNFVCILREGGELVTIFFTGIFDPTVEGTFGEFGKFSPIKTQRDLVAVRIGGTEKIEIIEHPENDVFRRMGGGVIRRDLRISSSSGLTFTWSLHSNVENES
jgi:hypothetical protein